MSEALQPDLRGTSAHGQVQRLYGALWQPGTGALHGARDLQSVGDDVYFAGTCAGPTLDDAHVTSLWRLDAQGGLHACWPGARQCRVSGLARCAAVVFSSESAEAEDELRLLPLQGDDALARWAAPGVIESLHWSPDGRRLLILLAGRAADVAGIAGGFALRPGAGGPAWLPEITCPDSADTWRSLWVWAVGDAAPRRLTQTPCNPWEAAWCGNEAVLAVASTQPGEGSWYQARLLQISLAGTQHVLRVPEDQLGLPAATADGRQVAWVEALCSDRGLVCGTVMLSNDGGPARPVEVNGIQATDLQWRDTRRLLVTGLFGFETVVAEIDTVSGDTRMLWTSGPEAATLSGWQPQAVPCGAQAALVVMEGYDRPPAIVELSPGRALTRLALGPNRLPGVDPMGRMERLRWQAPDGLDIYGWLITPERAAPPGGWPLVIDVHGGPVGAHRPRWAANLRAAPVLAQQGWAVLLPNPRGSSGRGQAFARQVVGDMGGADLQDLLAALDLLIAQGRVDPARVAVTGTSYGGYIACCMVTQTRRFAAAVPISPVSNWTSQHFGSQIPWFDSAFLRASPRAGDGPYFQRSPVFQAQGASTPTLVMAGGRDKNTPTGQAVEFYNALVEAGAPCALAVYPEDGHSLRGMPAYLDSAARVVAWLGHGASACCRVPGPSP